MASKMNRDQGWFRLPIELQKVKFELCVPSWMILQKEEDSEEGDEDMGAYTNYNTQLCLVCKRLRATALSTPRLWVNIVIGAIGWNLFSLERAILWATRAKEAPLSIYIKLATSGIMGTPMSTKEYILTIATFIQDHLAHCEGLHIAAWRNITDIEPCLQHPAPRSPIFPCPPQCSLRNQAIRSSPTGTPC